MLVQWWEYRWLLESALGALLLSLRLELTPIPRAIAPTGATRQKDDKNQGCDHPGCTSRRCHIQSPM